MRKVESFAQLSLLGQLGAAVAASRLFNITAEVLMTTRNGKSDEKVTAKGELASGDASRQPPIDKEKQESCDHNWEEDGQTLTSVKYSCTKCFKIRRSGIDI